MLPPATGAETGRFVRDGGLAKHEKGDTGVARRSLSAGEEADLIKRATDARDDESVEVGAGMRVFRGERSATDVTLRIPIEQYARLRELAAERGMLVAQFIEELVSARTGADRPASGEGSHGSSRRTTARRNVG